MDKTDAKPLTTVIVANAPELDLTTWLSHLKAAELIIAADGGANALHRVGLVPHVVIGDLDSLDDTTHTWLQQQGVEIQPLSREKDETDLEVALLLATQRNAAPIDLLGATGGRLDHTIANITMLTMDELRGRQVRVLTTDYELFVVRAGEQRTFQGQPHDTVSLLPLGLQAAGITIDGFYYPLTEATLRASRARGISNVLLTSCGKITLSEGMLLVIHHFDGGIHQWQSYERTTNELSLPTE